MTFILWQSTGRLDTAFQEILVIKELEVDKTISYVFNSRPMFSILTGYRQFNYRSHKDTKIYLRFLSEWSMGGRTNCDTSFSILFQSHLTDERMIVEVSVQWNRVYC